MAKKKRKKNKNEHFTLLALALFVTLVATAVIGSLFILPKLSSDTPQKKKPISIQIGKQSNTPMQGKGEVSPRFYTEGNNSVGLPTVKQQKNRSPRVAIIIDDVGVSKFPVRELLSLNIPITFAILPGQTHSSKIAAEIHEAGHEIMIHLPMEPVEGNGENIDENTLLMAHSSRELRVLTHKLILSIPYASGMNNHMGSLLTQDEEKMQIVMEEIKDAGLYTIDSLTTPESVMLSSARANRIKSASRDIFIDNDRSEVNIREALLQAIRHAKNRGSTIAIGHPHSITIKVLGDMKKEFIKSGIELVYASELAR